MRHHALPRSPFTTRLSGSARETELRIRSIFQWKKKRPPAALMALMLALILSCGGLASCQIRASDTGSYLRMDVQYYDTLENYIEIPSLVVPDGGEPDSGLTAIAQALAGLKAAYQPLLEGGDLTGFDYLTDRETHCLLFPTETERYLNLLFLRERFVTDLNTGHLFSLVYDKAEGRQVTMEDALAMAGTTEEELYQALADQYDPELAQRSLELSQFQDPEYSDVPIDLCIQNQVLEAFRIGADGQPIFYLTARSDDRDDSVSDAISGSDDIYIWSQGTFSEYGQYTMSPVPLVPAQECLPMDPPLYFQWYSGGGVPEGGFRDPSTAALPAG